MKTKKSRENTPISKNISKVKMGTVDKMITQLNNMKYRGKRNLNFLAEVVSHLEREKYNATFNVDNSIEYTYD